MSRQCVTHSLACDCREEKFRKIEEQLAEALKEVANVNLKWLAAETMLSKTQTTLSKVNHQLKRNKAEYVKKITELLESKKIETRKV